MLSSPLSVHSKQHFLLMSQMRKGASGDRIKPTTMCSHQHLLPWAVLRAAETAFLSRPPTVSGEALLKASSLLGIPCSLQPDSVCLEQVPLVPLQLLTRVSQQIDGIKCPCLPLGSNPDRLFQSLNPRVSECSRKSCGLHPSPQPRGFPLACLSGHPQ